MPKFHTDCCDNPKLKCPFCKGLVSHYPGGTVSDTDDIIYLVGESRNSLNGITNIFVYAHGECYRSDPHWRIAYG